MNPVFQGVGMGFAIAAPVGPIGVLCIRRTLHHGAAVGLASGLGAAIADGLYGVAVASGLALTGWLIRHCAAVRLIGASLLIWMGLGALHAFVRAASAGDTVPKSAVSPTTTRAAFASTFALTLSNPATIVGFVGVIGTLGSNGAASGATFLLVLGVFLGSMMWWTILVALVSRGRGFLLPTALRWIDLATGVVLVAMGLWFMAKLVP